MRTSHTHVVSQRVASSLGYGVAGTNQNGQKDKSGKVFTARIVSGLSSGKPHKCHNYIIQIYVCANAQISRSSQRENWKMHLPCQIKINSFNTRIRVLLPARPFCH